MKPPGLPCFNQYTQTAEKPDLGDVIDSWVFKDSFVSIKLLSICYFHSAFRACTKPMWDVVSKQCHLSLAGRKPRISPMISHPWIDRPMVTLSWISTNVCLLIDGAGFQLHTWWRHQMETFSMLLAICGNSPVLVNSPHKSQWRGALMFSLICAWITDE